LNSVFDHWLYSRIIENLCPTSWSKAYIEKSIGYDEIITPNISWKESLYEKLFHNNRCKGIYGIGPMGRILFSILLAVKPQKLEKLDEEENCEVMETDIEWPFDFSNIINKTVPLSFKDLKLIACESRDYKPGKYNLIGALLYYDEKAKFRLGLAAQSEEKLICSQHGGSYGIAKVYSYPTEVEYKQYCFFSWGWNRQEDYPGNIIALSSPLLSRFANKHRQISSNLIFVGTRAHLSMFRIEAGPQPLQNVQYRNEKVQFLKGLEAHILRNTLYRPYFNDYGALKERSYLEKILPTLQYCEGALHEKALRCKLLIIDHPDTSFNIALAANIPTIAFWDKKAWPFCRQAIPYFEALEKAGILFESAQDASMKVNKIWNDVQGWWNQESIQKARKDWCYKYARTSKLWWWEWAKKLWKI
jgi:putative transferase (TIGR04331 family)